MKITASDVNKLRKTTGAGMMDCKNALVEAQGDFDKAVENLRKKGQKIAANRAERESSEGVVIAKVNSEKTIGVIVSLNCETDFVAKNEKYIHLANEIVGFYIHAGNKISTLVGLSNKFEKSEEVAKNIAMQAAAMNPIALNENEVDATIIEKEIEIAKEQLRQEGKPEEMLDNIAKGKIKRFFKDNTLVNQAYIKDNKISVSDYVESVGEIEITGFERVSLV